MKGRVVIHVSPGYALFVACRALVEAVGGFIHRRKVEIEVWSDLPDGGGGFYVRANTGFQIVDNAAAASPDSPR